MKKIISREELAKKTSRNQFIVGMVLVALMLLSTLGYALTGRSDTQTIKKAEYKGISFTKTNDYWGFNSNSYDFITRYYPEETKSLSVSNKMLISDFAGKPLYLASDIGQPNPEITRNLNTIVLRMQNACLSKENCTGDYPIKDCSQDNVIILKIPIENEKERVFQNEKCVFITASEENQTMYSDAFLFSALGI